jgi:hypothetical protein
VVFAVSKSFKFLNYFHFFSTISEAFLFFHGEGMLITQASDLCAVTVEFLCLAQHSGQHVLCGDHLPRASWRESHGFCHWSPEVRPP